MDQIERTGPDMIRNNRITLEDFLWIGLQLRPLLPIAEERRWIENPRNQNR